MDVVPQRAETLAEQVGARAVPSIDALVALSDAVIVCVPPRWHADVVAQVVDAGTPVLVEKPIALSVKEGLDMLAHAASRGVPLAVAEATQHWRPVTAMAEAVAQGAIGEVVAAIATVVFPPVGEFYEGPGAWRFDRTISGGGVVLDTGPHYIRALRLCAGEIRSVVGCAPPPRTPQETERSAHVLARTSSGALAGLHIVLSAGSSGRGDQLRITGTSGELVMSERGEVVRYAAGGEHPLVNADMGDYFASFTPQLADFVAAVVEGKPLCAPPQDAVRDLAVVEAVYRSIAAFAWQAVEPIDGPTHAR